MNVANKSSWLMSRGRATFLAATLATSIPSAVGVQAALQEGNHFDYFLGLGDQNIQLNGLGICKVLFH